MVWPRTAEEQNRTGDFSGGVSSARNESTKLQHFDTTENGSVPIQLALCWFPGLDISMLKFKYVLQIKYTEAFLSNTTRKLLWFEISKMLIAVLEYTLCPPKTSTFLFF